MATIFMAGDSTMQQNDWRTYPQIGWGQAFASCVDPLQHTVRNYARNGRSTKSFIADGRLDWIEKEIQAGDFLLLQFGHNDQKEEDASRFTEPFGEYQENLRKMSELALKAKAYPVILTSVSRRLFGENGKIQPDIMGDYPEAARQLAEQMNIPLIDVCTFSVKKMEQLGERESLSLVMNFPENQYENYPEGKEDNTHLRMDGAMLIASFVAKELEKLGAPYSEILLTQENDYLDRP